MKHPPPATPAQSNPLSEEARLIELSEGRRIEIKDPFLQAAVMDMQRQIDESAAELRSLRSTNATMSAALDAISGALVDLGDVTTDEVRGVSEVCAELRELRERLATNAPAADDICARIMALSRHLPDSEYMLGSIAGDVRLAIAAVEAEAYERAALACEENSGEVGMFVTEKGRVGDFFARLIRGIRPTRGGTDG